jgi:hypothetical protein
LDQNGQERPGLGSHERPPLPRQSYAPVLFLRRYVLHQALGAGVLAGTELAKAQPSTVILKLFKIAVRVVQYKDRIKLQLPSRCPAKPLLIKICDLLCQAQGPVLNTT